MHFTNQEIPTSYARQLAKNFRELKLKKGTIKKDDAQGMWFSRQTLLAALGIPDTETGISGIRFYLGAYEENCPGHPKDPKDKGKITLVLVQTRTATENGNKIQKDILQDPTALPDYPEGFREFNDGQLCPPPACDNDGLLNFE